MHMCLSPTKLTCMQDAPDLAGPACMAAEPMHPAILVLRPKAASSLRGMPAFSLPGHQALARLTPVAVISHICLAMHQLQENLRPLIVSRALVTAPQEFMIFLPKASPKQSVILLSDRLVACSTTKKQSVCTTSVEQKTNGVSRHCCGTIGHIATVVNGCCAHVWLVRRSTRLLCRAAGSELATAWRGGCSVGVRCFRVSGRSTVGRSWRKPNLESTDLCGRTFSL